MIKPEKFPKFPLKAQTTGWILKIFRWQGDFWLIPKLSLNSVKFKLIPVVNHDKSRKFPEIFPKNPEISWKIPKKPKNLPPSGWGGSGFPGHGGYFPKKISQGGISDIPPCTSLLDRLGLLTNNYFKNKRTQFINLVEIVFHCTTLCVRSSIGMISVCWYPSGTLNSASDKSEQISKEINFHLT